MARTDPRAWLEKSLPQHEKLRVATVSLLENILREDKIEYLSIEGRVKTLDSSLEKITRKGYGRPELQLTDLTGIRVITFLESQVTQVSKSIRRLFIVDEKNSLDRASILGNDKIGYRSTHFVCSLGKKRENFPEYRQLGTLKFEIQVRTVLQHAWAELAHDRAFKFGPGLPALIERKLNLYSGMLEVVDSGFDTISNEIDDYRRSLESKTIKQISDVEISTLSLEKFIDASVKNYGLKIENLPFDTQIISELKHFGINTIGQLEAITTADLVKQMKKWKLAETTNYGFIRNILFYNDIEKYLSGPSDWTVMYTGIIDFLATKYDRNKLETLLKKAGKSVHPVPKF